MNNERPTIAWIVCGRGLEELTAKKVTELRKGGIDARVVVSEDVNVTKLVSLIAAYSNEKATP